MLVLVEGDGVMPQFVCRGERVEGERLGTVALNGGEFMFMTHVSELIDIICGRFCVGHHRQIYFYGL